MVMKTTNNIAATIFLIVLLALGLKAQESVNKKDTTLTSSKGYHIIDFKKRRVDNIVFERSTQRKVEKVFGKNFTKEYHHAHHGGWAGHGPARIDMNYGDTISVQLGHEKLFRYVVQVMWLKMPLKVMTKEGIIMGKSDTNDLLRVYGKPTVVRNSNEFEYDIKTNISEYTFIITKGVVTGMYLNL